MNKIKSRKFWAFIVWGILILAEMIFKFEIPEYIIDWFGRVTCIYIGFQGAVDTAMNWKKGNNE